MLLTAYSLRALFCLISAIVCLLTGCLLLLFGIRKNKTNIFLGLSYLDLALGSTVMFLGFSGLMYYVPHFYRTGQFFLLLYMPLSYLYIRSSITHKPITVRQLVHIIPALIYLIDYLPFFVSSSSYKRAAFQAAMNNEHFFTQFREGWLLPDNFGVPLRTVTMAFYWILQLWLLASVNTAFFRKNIMGMRWLYIYNALQIPLFLPILIVALIGGQSLHFATTIPAAAAGLLSAVTLFLYPRILYNFEVDHAPPPKPTRIKPGLDNATILQLNIRLDKIMKEDKPYLHPDFTLGELAEILGISPHKLSAFINQVTGKNFSDYLNHWRIQYCLDLIREKKATNLNLNGIAIKCGFNNRNTFSAAFKKMTGETPSAYLHAANYHSI
jgi:AraC-like DNA-binding protein